ncbi:MAG: ATP-binding cassette domain-containing protein [candidate division NC10 bacterium]|nr:ATP-binding cassette domain-containing protein [candidate division NC10 bacterium]
MRCGSRAGCRGRGPEARPRDRGRQPRLARPGPPAGPAARAGSAPRPRGASGRAPGRADARGLRGVRGAQATRRREARLTSPAGAVRRYAAPYWARYAAGVLCLAVATLASLAIPWMLKQAIDALQTDAAAAPLGRYVAAIVLFALANGAARLGSRFAIIGAAQRIEYDLRNDLYASLETRPPAFCATHPTGDLMARASSDVPAVRSLLGFGIVSLVGTVFAFVGTLVAMLALDPWLTLWALAPYPALIVLAKRFNAVVHERTQAVQDQLAVLSARVQEHLAGMAVVRAYALEGRAARDFARENGEYLGRSLALARSMSSFAPLMGLIAGVGTLVVLWAGGKAVVDGRLSLGALAAFNGYLAYLTWPTIALGWTLSIVRRGLTSMGRIQEVIGLGDAKPHRAFFRPPTALAEHAVPATVVAGTAGPASTEGGPGKMRDGSALRSPIFSDSCSIRFANLTFAYEGRPAALRQVSFSVAPGETVAVVGPTGSGKTTLGLLLARLWEPPPGTIFVGELDVTTLDRQALRARLGYVPQEGFLFSRSIHENIALGRDGVDARRVREAAAAAGIVEEVERFPAGFDTVVGERGLTLSGGQRQRVALARALVAAPPILVLDDAFASVDAAKEEEIVANLRGVTAGRTVLLMTHRLRAAQAADRVVVLDEGRVVETGRHDDLVQAGGVYARLWRVQQLEEEIGRA